MYQQKHALFRNYKTMLVGLVALLTVLAIGLTLSGCSTKPPVETQAATEAAKPLPTEAAKPSEAPTEAPTAPTEAPTEATANPNETKEKPAPITAVEIVDPMSAYISYWEELQANRDRIEGYAWGDQTALFDVYGNEIPELFYFAQNPEEPYYYDLYVCTYSAGKVYPIQTFPRVFGEVQITDSVAIFGSKAEKAMAVYYADCTETQISRSVTLFRDWDAPEVRAEKLEAYDGPEQTGEEYYALGAPSDEVGYEQACRDALAGFDAAIINTTNGYYEPTAVNELLDGKEPVSCSLADMIAFLESKMSGN